MSVAISAMKVTRFRYRVMEYPFLHRDSSSLTNIPTHPYALDESSLNRTGKNYRGSLTGTDITERGALPGPQRGTLPSESCQNCQQFSEGDRRRRVRSGLRRSKRLTSAHVQTVASGGWVVLIRSWLLTGALMMFMVSGILWPKTRACSRHCLTNFCTLPLS